MTDASTPPASRPRHPLIAVAAGQLAGAAVALAGGMLLARLPEMTLPMPAAGVVAWSALAVAVGRWLGLRRWWLAVQALLPPALVLGLLLPVPPWVYLLAFLLLLAVQWNAARGRVPLYLTNRRTWAALAGLLVDRPGARVADLGSGLGGTVAALARRLPDSHVVGIESAPLPFVISRLRVAVSGAGGRAAIRYGDYRRQDLGAFDAVYCFLSPVPMPEVFAKAKREMRPGSLLISNSFEVPGHPADRVVTVDDRRRTRLLVWRM